METLIKHQNYIPLFPIDLVEKDYFNYGEHLGVSVGAKIPIITAVRDIFREAQEVGYEADNIASVARLFV